MFLPGMLLAAVCALTDGASPTQPSQDGAGRRLTPAELDAYLKARVAEVQAEHPGATWIFLGAHDAQGREIEMPKPAEIDTRVRIWQLTQESLEVALRRTSVNDATADEMRATMRRYLDGVTAIDAERNSEASMARRTRILTLQARLEPPDAMLTLLFGTVTTREEPQEPDPRKAQLDALADEDREEGRRLRDAAAVLARDFLHEADTVLAHLDAPRPDACIGRLLIGSLRTLGRIGGRMPMEYDPPDIGDLVEHSLESGVLCQVADAIAAVRGPLDALEFRSECYTVALAFDAAMAPRARELFTRRVPPGETSMKGAGPWTAESHGDAFYVPLELLGANWGWRYDLSRAHVTLIADLLDAWAPDAPTADALTPTDAWRREWIAAACENLKGPWWSEQFFDWLRTQEDADRIDLDAAARLQADASQTLLRLRLATVDAAARYCRRAGTVISRHPAFQHEHDAFLAALNTLARTSIDLGRSLAGSLPDDLGARAQAAMAGAIPGPSVHGRPLVEGGHAAYRNQIETSGDSRCFILPTVDQPRPHATGGLIAACS